LLSLVSLALIFVQLQRRYRSAALALIIKGGVPLALSRKRGRTLTVCRPAFAPSRA
jgi:hypothetical protein